MNVAEFQVAELFCFVFCYVFFFLTVEDMQNNKSTKIFGPQEAAASAGAALVTSSGVF